MGYAAYVGRVGALAVALGIATAVANTPGMAWAEPGSSPSSSGSSDPGAKNRDDREPPSGAAAAGGGVGSSRAGKGSQPGTSPGSADAGRAGSGRQAAQSGSSARSEGSEDRDADDAGSTTETSSKTPADTAEPGIFGVPAPHSVVGGVDAAEAAGGGVAQPDVADPGVVASGAEAETAQPPATSAESQPPISVEPQPALPVEPQPAAVVSSAGAVVPTAAEAGGRPARHRGGAAGGPAGQFGGTAAAGRDAGPGGAARDPDRNTVNAEKVLAPAPQVWPGTAPGAGAGWVPQDVPDMSVAPEPRPAARAVVSSDVDAPTMTSKVLRWLGSSGLLDSTPTGPVDSPILWAMMAAVRKPGGKSGIDTGVAGAGAGVQTGLVVDDAVELMAAPVTVDAASATAPSAFGQVKTATPRTQQLARIAGRDTTAPTVSLTAPAAGATVSGTVTLSATASDNVGVAGVQFLLDGTSSGRRGHHRARRTACRGTPPTVANGTHTLTARARDAAGNTTTSTAVTVTVDNAHHGTHGEPHRARRRGDRVGHGEPHRHRLRQCRGGRGAVLLGKALGRRR